MGQTVAVSGETIESVRLAFRGPSGADLAARLDLPTAPPRAYAVFAHCFTCSKDILAARAIAAALATRGFAVLRFDFTGLGASGGEFAHTNFSSNVEDLVAAADHLREHFAAPALLVGHSLGGAAVLAAAESIPEVVAVATLGAPADVAHVLHNFGSNLPIIESEGSAEVVLGGRLFRVARSFVTDAVMHRLEDKIARLRRALLVLHAPGDETVGIENAARIFEAARHPKSFVSLDDADHLLSRADDARYAANVIAAWCERYMPH